MRKLYLLAFSLALSPLAAAQYCVPCFEYSVLADYNYLWRNEIHSRPFGLRAGKRVLTGRKLVKEMEGKSAIRGAYSFYISDRGEIELLYTYMFPWKGTLSANGPVSFPFIDPITISDFVGANHARAFDETQIQNAEINYWKHLTPARVNYFAFAWNLGFRFIYLKDHFNLTYTKLTNVSNYRINTHNYMFGAQAGWTLDWNPNSSFTWTGRMKADIFYNNGSSNVFFGDLNNRVIRRDYSIRTQTTGFLLEAFGQLAFHVATNFDIHAGYQGFLLTGLVLAPAQIDRTSKDRRYFYNSDQVLIHGPFVGLQWNF